jgi:hypothetical protein
VASLASVVANRSRYCNALSLRCVGGFAWQPRD